MNKIDWQNYLLKPKMISLLLFFSLIAAQINFVFAQKIIKPRGDTLYEKQLKIELTGLEELILKNINNDIELTSDAFTSSASILSDLKIAYPILVVGGTVKDGFSIVQSVKSDGIYAVFTSKINFSLTVATIILALDNARANGEKLNILFDKDRYVDSVLRMLKAARATQPETIIPKNPIKPLPEFEFDNTAYRNFIHLWLLGSEGEETLFAKRAKINDVCQIIKPRGEIVEKRPPLRGVVEIRRYISSVFQQLEQEIDAREFSETGANALIELIRKSKRTLIESQAKPTEITLSLPESIRPPYCNPSATEINLGNVAQHQAKIQMAYDTLNKKLEIEEEKTIKLVGDLLRIYATTRLVDGNGIEKQVLQTTSKISFAFGATQKIEEWLTRKSLRERPEEIIANTPQEMLLSLPIEFSQIVLMTDTLASIIRYVINQPKKLPPKTPPIKIVAPEIPTLFLFDVSGSMLENDKIGQARNSSLIALREIQENKRLGRGETSVSVWTFSGGCSPSAARQILPFTGNLAQAENTLSAGIPRPDGGTPLPQAVDKAKNQVSDYLNSRPQLAEGRVILLSDGQSTCGEIRPAGTYSQAKTITVKNIRFLTIGFDVPAGSAAERDLQYLASASGGQYFPAQNQQQLIRAFERTIRVYLPKVVANASAEFENAANAIVNRDFETARRILGEYVRNNPSDSFGFYNLAVSLEALSRYKGAAENYRKHLQFAPGATDRREIETRIGKLEQDYRDQIFYYRSLLQSDLEYLTAYYKRLFGLKNVELAAEFAGFVGEKRSFYAGLPDILEIKTSWLKRGSEELSDSLGRLSNRVNLPSFDRDAVSLLPLPISQLEELVERLDEYNAQNFR